MAERCPDCGRLKYDSEHDDFCEVYTELRDARARIAKLEAECEAQRQRANNIAGIFGLKCSRVAELETECARLRREVEDVRKLDELGDWNMRREDGFSICSTHVALTPPAARRAAVEYLEQGLDAAKAELERVKG